MKTDYTDIDIARGFAWYAQHKPYVDRALLITGKAFPMSGSDISHPELWKIGAWKWFFLHCIPPIAKEIPNERL